MTVYLAGAGYSIEPGAGIMQTSRQMRESAPATRHMLSHLGYYLAQIATASLRQTPDDYSGLVAFYLGSIASSSRRKTIDVAARTSEENPLQLLEEVVGKLISDDPKLLREMDVTRDQVSAALSKYAARFPRKLPQIAKELRGVVAKERAA
jgi:hypothetical protein